MEINLGCQRGDVNFGLGFQLGDENFGLGLKRCCGNDACYGNFGLGLQRGDGGSRSSSRSSVAGWAQVVCIPVFSFVVPW